MTTRQKLENQLFQHGMFESQAKEVVENAIPSLNEEMKEINYRITWDRPASEYPDVFHNLLFSKVKPFAYKWYEENLPQAWNKEIFKS